ncbi:MAG: NADP-dependent isocitrate dehydrogenase [Chlamydiales bacterium]|nr:NADP-dependent isocitrate dehydrogenase [Chlamydiales bacterium]
MAPRKASIAVARGDGIGPEIMDATLHILGESGADLDIQEVEIGEKVYLRGQTAGIEPQTWEILRNTDAFLKAPLTTPQGGGFKSINVTIRTLLGLYANVRPCVAYYPFVETLHPKMDVVIVRENIEDLYIGLEYRQTPDAVQALKLITRSGCERIVRYAFEYAEANQRKKVTCFTKDNILKLSDGLFHKVFDEIGENYPNIEKEHWIVDIGAAKLADSPDTFDVIVMPNLYGDILSDVAAQIAGSVGLAGSANIGDHGAMFEAIHGSAPRRANQNLANPSGLLLAAVMMLNHVGQPEPAMRIHNAWLRTLEDGIHTYDIFKEGISKQKVGTKEFARAVVARLGQMPEKLKPAVYAAKSEQALPSSYLEKKSAELSKEKVLDGVDVFVQADSSVEELQAVMSRFNNQRLELTLIANRGAKAWPDPMPETSLCDHWRCRYLGADDVNHKDIAELLKRIAEANVDFVQIENLYSFGGEVGYSIAQGETPRIRKQ